MNAKDAKDAEVSLITHKRQMDSIALLCKKGQMITPVFHILMAGMGGREGAQSPEEVKMLSEIKAGIAPEEKLLQASLPH